ncbi:hypothetical protein HNQ69_001461 [Bartonella callosciuri]|uniref:Uncharacterized protein n=1 Tax=Bartonella callosciuri TaxID=686223 RepID=A0A840NWM2_9HYPH|nr:hypothetical protein [Bartonella callosciuri]MBB5074323.1 hypothetical protein [Bartonella callosciuri]
MRTDKPHLLHYSPLPASLIHKIALKAQMQGAGEQSAPLHENDHVGGEMASNMGDENLMQSILH